MANCYTVYCFIVSNLTGEAQREIMTDGFLGKPARVMKTLDRIYDPSQKPGELQKVKKELKAFQILKIETIVAMNFQLNLLIKKYKKLGGDVTEKEKIDYLKNTMRAPKWDKTIKKIVKKSKAQEFTYEQAFEILIKVEKFIVERDMRRKEDNELITLQKVYATLERKLQNQTSIPSSSNSQSSFTYQIDKYAAFQVNSNWCNPPKGSNACWHCGLAEHCKNSCPDKSHQRSPSGVLAETEFCTFEEARRKWKIEMLNKGFQIYTLLQFIDALIVKKKSFFFPF